MRLDVKEVLSESAAFYKQYFKEIAGVAFINLLFSMIMNATTFIQKALDGIDPSSIAPGLGIVMILLGFVINIGLLIFIVAVLPRLPLTSMILINSFFVKKQTLRNAYYRTGGKYWIVVRCFLILVLLALPAFALVIHFEIPYNSYWITVCFSLLSPFFYTLLPMIALEPKTKHYLRRAVQMMRGNYITILILNVLCTTLFTVLYYIVSGLVGSHAITRFVVSMVHSLVFFFISPFADTVTVFVYRKLTNQSTVEPVEAF